MIKFIKVLELSPDIEGCFTKINNMFFCVTTFGKKILKLYYRINRNRAAGAAFPYCTPRRGLRILRSRIGLYVIHIRN